MGLNGKLLTAGEILGAQDLKFTEVDVPEWGGVVRLRELSARDREWFLLQSMSFEATVDAKGVARTKTTPKVIDTRAALLSRAIVDENGNPIFDEAEVKNLGGKNDAVIARLFAAAQALSSMGPAAVDDAEKNSGAGPSAGSPSDSPGS